MAMNVDNNSYNPQVDAAQGVQNDGSSGQAGWKDADTVSQLQPDGDSTSQNYVDGAYNCGPATAATLARMMGTRGGQSNSSLVSELGNNHDNTEDGTKPGSMIGMIQDVGGKVDGNTLVGNYKDEQLDGVLAKGNKAVMQVGLQGPDGQTKEGTHWVIVNGKDQDGNYLVKDSLNGDYKATPEQLRDAFHKAGKVGGTLIPVAPENAPSRTQSLSDQGINTGNYAPANDTTPFTTDPSRIEGVDPEFKQYAMDAFEDSPKGAAAADPGENDNLLNQTALQGHDVDGSAPAVTDGQTAEGAAQNLLDLLSQDDENGRNGLDSVSNSHNEQDIKVFTLMLQEFAKQGGIGQRPSWANTEF